MSDAERKKRDNYDDDSTQPPKRGRSLSPTSSSEPPFGGEPAAAAALVRDVKSAFRRCFGSWAHMSPRDRQKADDCAEKLAAIDPDRYRWVAEVRSSKRPDALCFVAVREFGRVDQAIGSIDDFCGWLHAAVRNTMDLGQRLLGGPTAECTTCLADLAAADASLMPCSHFGHTSCLKTWLGRNPSCPECRAATDPKSLVPMRAIGSLAARTEMQERPRKAEESDARKTAREAMGSRRAEQERRRALVSRAKDAFLRPIRKLPKIGCVAAGYGHTVVLMEDGSVRAFGLDNAGQLGGGSVSTPIPEINGTSGEKKAAQVAAGFSHTVILMKDGSVRAFGLDNAGQLGGGSVSKPIPEIDGTSDKKKAAQVAAGGHYTVVLMKDGSVRAFGRNNEGQLGGGSVSEPIPEIDGTSDEKKAAQVATGGFHTVVLMKDGSVRAFGVGGNDGHLGGGSVSEPIPEIDGTSDEKKAAQVAAGHGHTVVLMKDGSVRTFGYATEDQLGGGSVSYPIEAIDGTSDEKKAAQVAAGGSQTVVLMNDGSVRAFGNYRKGVLGQSWVGGSVSHMIPAIKNGAAKCHP